MVRTAQCLQAVSVSALSDGAAATRQERRQTYVVPSQAVAFIDFAWLDRGFGREYGVLESSSTWI